jgi:hypothetical protein
MTASGTPPDPLAPATLGPLTLRNRIIKSRPAPASAARCRQAIALHAMQQVRPDHLRRDPLSAQRNAARPVTAGVAAVARAP